MVSQFWDSFTRPPTPPVETPWGPSQVTETIADGVVFHSTAGHGGLRLSVARWNELPEPVQDSLVYTRWAEEDCETPIVLAILGLAEPGVRQVARRWAEQFYPACLPFIPQD